MRGSARIVAAALALMMVAVACGGGGTESPSATASATRGGSYSYDNGEPASLIPQNDYEAFGQQVLEALFTRLMTYDQDGKAIPAQAASVTPSSDGLTYTIKIKDGWTFHNGEPVTARSYVDAWNYAAYGPNGYVLNFFFDRIAGYDALNPSTGKPKSTELSGLKVVDNTTFTVELTAPFSQFPQTLGFDAFDPLPKVFFKDPDAFNEMPIGDGPYMMDGPWKHDETVDLKRYPDYAGTPGYADEIRLPIYTGDAAWADFQAGNLDINYIGARHLVDAENSYADSLQRDPSSAYYFIGIPLYDDAFKSKELRQALSMAVDRQAVINAILVNESPADDAISPAIQGYRQGACQYCTLDAAAAKQKLAEAGGWTGTMTLNFYSGDAAVEQGMEAIANQWKQNLGIDVRLNPINANDYYSVIIHEKMTGPWWDGWVMDYPSMQDYLTPLYGSNGGYNVSGYDNPKFDDLMAQGDAAPSITDAIPAYQQADDIILEDMPVIPWGYGEFATVHQPTVTNVQKAGPLDLLALELVQVVQA